MYLHHLIFLTLVSAGAAYLMIFAGLSKRALEPRRARRSCPSCGRAARECCCRG